MQFKILEQLRLSLVIHMRTAMIAKTVFQCLAQSVIRDNSLTVFVACITLNYKRTFMLCATTEL
jgi:hypothetical protein